MRIFRAAEAPPMDEPNPDYSMTYAPLAKEAEIGIARSVEAGILDGLTVRVLFSAPGFSLTYGWFKPGFPLVRHSHDADCLYYIVSGWLKLGTQRLGAGDGFFLPADTPYTYAVGEEGLEILEFRHSQHYDFRTAGGTAAQWDRVVDAIADNRERWKAMVPPRAAA